MAASQEQDFGTANLHMEVSDIISVLVYVGVAKGNGVLSKTGKPEARLPHSCQQACPLTWSALLEKETEGEKPSAGAEMFHKPLSSQNMVSTLQTMTFKRCIWKDFALSVHGHRSKKSFYLHS